jgi:CBS-domain-containing membrane protein
VLKAGSLMRPLDQCERDGDRVFVDASRQAALRLDGQSKPQVETGSDIQLTSAQTTLKDVIALRQKSGHGVGIVDEDGRLVGVCTDADIYSGLIQQKRD